MSLLRYIHIYPYVRGNVGGLLSHSCVVGSSDPLFVRMSYDVAREEYINRSVYMSRWLMGSMWRMWLVKYFETDMIVRSHRESLESRSMQDAWRVRQR